MTTLGVILAGGRSSRMGGGDKPLLELGGKPIVAHAIDGLGSSVDAIAINANGDPARFEQFGVPVITDLVEGFEGPLAGIHAALRYAHHAGHETVATVAGDTPFFPPDIVARLRAAGNADTIRVAFSNDRLHPVFALWPASLEADLLTHLTSGGTRKVLSFIEVRPHAVAEFEPVNISGGDVDPFFNINTPEDLALARVLLDGAR